MVGAVSHIKSVTIADGTNTDIVRPSDWDSVHKYGATISGNTFGNSTWTGTNLVLQLSGELSGSLTGNTLVLSRSEPLRSYWAQMVGGASQTPANVSISGSSSQVMPFFLPYDISADFFRLPVGFATAGNSAATVANSTGSGGISTTFQYVLYSQGTGASSQSLMSVTSGSVLQAQRLRFQMNANGSQYSQSYEYTYPIYNTTSQSTTQGSQSTSNLSFFSTHLTALSGPRALDLPFGGTLSAGAYWLALGFSTASGGDTKGTRLQLNLGTFWYASVGSVTFAVMGSTSVAAPVGGAYSNAGAATTAAIAVSQLTALTNAQMFPIHLLRSA